MLQRPGPSPTRRSRRSRGTGALRLVHVEPACRSASRGHDRIPADREEPSDAEEPAGSHAVFAMAGVAIYRAEAGCKRWCKRTPLDGTAQDITYTDADRSGCRSGRTQRHRTTQSDTPVRSLLIPRSWVRIPDGHRATALPDDGLARLQKAAGGPGRWLLALGDAGVSGRTVTHGSPRHGCYLQRGRASWGREAGTAAGRWWTSPGCAGAPTQSESLGGPAGGRGCQARTGGRSTSPGASGRCRGTRTSGSGELFTQLVHPAERDCRRREIKPARAEETTAPGMGLLPGFLRNGDQVQP